MYVHCRPKCESCESRFSEQRALKAHQKTCQKHLEKTGRRLVRYPCQVCGSSFSRLWDVKRHIYQGQCLKAPPASGSQTVSNRKHALSFHEDSPSQRLRTTSPTRGRVQVEDYAGVDVVSCEANTVAELGDTDTKLEALVRTHLYGDDMTTSNLTKPIGNVSSSTVGVNRVKVETLGDTDFHQVPRGAEASPSTGSRETESTILPTEGTPGNDVSEEVQALPTTSSGEVSNVDSVDSLTNGLARTSLEVQGFGKKRSSFANSIKSGCSATSQWTLPSMRSFLTNPSLSHLSIRSIRSSNMSRRRASTVPSVMPAPMLEPIDEELINSRGLSGRLERYIPLRKPRAIQQQDPHERLRMAINTNDVEEVSNILASGRGVIDINCLDENGCTPLLEAARHGHESIIAVLLEQENIDVHRRDSRGSTALLWAQRQGHSNIADQLEAFMSSERGNRGQGDHHVDSGGICCEMLALPPKPLNLALGSAENQRALWHACEIGDAMKVARLITDKKVDINCSNPHGRTSLSIAAAHGYHEIVSWLLEHDDVDTAVPDANGATALTWAAAQGHIRVVQLLLCHKDAASRDDTIITASMALAQKNGHTEIVEMLMLD